MFRPGLANSARAYAAARQLQEIPDSPYKPFDDTVTFTQAYTVTVPEPDPAVYYWYLNPSAKGAQDFFGQW